MTTNKVVTIRDGVVTTTEFSTITTVEFFTVVKDVREASVLFRQAVGAISSLNDSLLGGHPACARDMALYIRTHQKVRRFKDEEGLRDYVGYLTGLIERAPDECAPSLSYLDDGRGFCYTTHSGRSTIGICGVENGWSVSGKANFLNPDIATRNLSRAGFNVKCESKVS